MTVRVEAGVEFPRNALLRRLIDLQYERNDVDFHRGTLRVRGDAVELFPAYEEERVLRIEYDEDRIARILHVDPLRGTRIRELRETVIFPASHYRDPGGSARAGGPWDRGGASKDGSRSSTRRGSARGGAAEAEDHLRPGDDLPDGVLLRHRELLPPSRRACPRTAAVHPPRLFPEGDSSPSSTSPTLRFPS